MSLGPIEMLVVKFPGTRLRGEIAPAIEELVENGTIRLIDLVFVAKASDGTISVKEMNDLDDDDFGTFDPIVEDITGLVSDEDIALICDALEPDSSAGMMLVEHRWAARLQDAILGAHGEFVVSEHIPRDVVEVALAAAATPV